MRKLLFTAGNRKMGRPAAIALVALLASGVPFSQAAHAQHQTAPAIARVGVTAHVLPRLGIFGVNNLSFGQIAATLSGATARVEKGSTNAGRFEVTGADRQEIRVAFVAPSELTGPGGQSIGVELEVYGASSLGGASSARRVLTNETVILSGGRYFLFIGGELRVGPLGQNSPGRYTGDFELGVTHVGL